jgi:nucleoside-diphosphate-sugar epimerase
MADEYNMSRVLVTGPDGFIGRTLMEALNSAGHQAVPAAKVRILLEKRSTPNPPLDSLLRDCSVVIHLAGRAHVIRELHNDPSGEFRKANLHATLSMADIAAKAGVTRFVFVSSIGVLGNTSGRAVFNERDVPSPKEPYAVSKWEAERALGDLARTSGMQIVVVRPPLVYGPHVKGNFLRLLRLVACGVPLPFGAIHNSRSYVGVHNLCDLLISCAFHPSAAGLTFNVADGEDVSTPELVAMMASAMGRRARLFSCPMALLRATTTALGKRDQLERLTANLRVDSSLAQSTLNWRPSKTLRVGIAEMVQWYVQETRTDR